MELNEIKEQAQKIIDLLNEADALKNEGCKPYLDKFKEVEAQANQQLNALFSENDIHHYFRWEPSNGGYYVEFNFECKISSKVND